ncbi:hypothetical protein C8034_v011411 [Colletotrichum sidae]|uniref:Replicase polyprotein 1a n=1 Tax=Colletotrichum sidae TaxID=1347389 RepID=A0A4V6QFI5_9PEZI|nr:hypothetical protein C8034_v011411 [Colletotrichum sidae]
MPRGTRPSTPSMMLGPLRDLDSPPQTPTSTSSMLAQKQFAARHLPPPYHNFSRPVLHEDSGIQPTGNGHQFSFTPSNRFLHLSPRTSSEDSDDEEEEDDEEQESKPESESDDNQGSGEESDDEDEDDGDDEESSEEESEDDEEEEDEDVPMMNVDFPPAPAPAPPVPTSRTAHLFAPRMNTDSSSSSTSSSSSSDSESESESKSTLPPPVPELPHRTAPKANFTLEELSDFDPMDHDRSNTIGPSGFSSPASARSRSHTRAAETPTTSTAAAPPPEPPLHEMRRLTTSDSESSDIDDEAALRDFARTQRELRMRKRRSHGSSIGKRTISERSDSDHEDCAPLDPDAVGSSARRLRRRVGDRRSFILFQDPPPPRIDELDEPESEVEGAVFYCDGETLARELPYWSIEIMEYESPSP